MRIGIIGGGIYGCSLAYYLSKRGSVDVHLYERGAVGGTSTARSVGIVRHHYSDPVQIRVADRGRELLAELDAARDGGIGLRRNGYLILAGPSQESAFREIVATQQRLGIDVELRAPDSLPSLVPEIDPAGVAVAALERDAGFADPHLAATAFAAAARENGATVHANTPVTDIVVDGDRIEAIETPDGDAPVDYLVDAAGPRAGKVAAMTGVDLPLTVYEAKAAVLRSDRSFGPDRPTVSDVDLGLYAKPEPGGDFVIGGMERRSDHVALERPAATSGVTTADLRWVARTMEERLPGYADAAVVDTWSGPITASPDWHQLIGRPPALRNFHVVAAGSGHGFKDAPGFTESVARLILGDDPVIDLAPYRLTRFREDNAFDRRYADGSRS